MSESGVYEILNTINGKRYVGSSVNLPQRKRAHWSSLGKDSHHSAYLQRSWNKYGDAAFRFAVIEYWEPEFLIAFEQWWMNMLRPEYNIAPVASSSLGVKHTAETCAKLSARMKGASMPPETRAKISATLMGHKVSAETRTKIGAAGMGRIPSAETRVRIGAGGMGRKFSAEARKKMSAAAKKRWHDEK